MRTATSIPRLYADASGLKHGELTEKLIGIFFSIHNELGHGFLESVYEQAFSVLLAEDNIFFRDKLPYRFGSTNSRLASSEQICSWTGECWLN